MLRGASVVIAWSFALLLGAAACQAEPKVTIITQKGSEVAFYVEVADTPAKREMGLQYRRELAENRGMIFIFPAESRHSFWMKNTPIALDMIFIDSRLRIVGIVEQTKPFSLDPRGVAAPSRYVLEINGGLSKRHGIQVGDSVRLDGVAVDAVKK